LLHSCNETTKFINAMSAAGIGWMSPVKSLMQVFGVRTGNSGYKLGVKDVADRVYWVKLMEKMAGTGRYHIWKPRAACLREWREAAVRSIVTAQGMYRKRTQQRVKQV
jgi:hypothetical protein